MEENILQPTGLSLEEQEQLYSLLKKATVNACNYTNKKYVEVDK